MKTNQAETLLELTAALQTATENTALCVHRFLSQMKLFFIVAKIQKCVFITLTLPGACGEN